MFLKSFDLKMPGCVLLCLSVLWIGLIHVKNLRRKPQALRDLADGLSVVLRVSCSEMAPLTEAFGEAANCTEISACFFRRLRLGLEANLSLPMLWTESVRSFPLLSPQESQSVNALKNALGCSDIVIQRSELEACISYLREQAEEARLAAASGARMTLGLSVVCSLMLAVLMY